MTAKPFTFDLTVHQPGTASGTAEFAGKPYTFSVFSQRTGMTVMIYQRDKFRSAWKRRLPNTALVPLREALTTACQNDPKFNPALTNAVLAV